MKKRIFSQKCLLIIIGVLILLGVVTGISYAYWRFTVAQVKNNKMASSCLSISLTEESDAINLQKAYPIVDEEGMSQTPYTFTIKNTCDSFISYEVALGITNESTLDSKYIAAVLDKNAIKLLSEYEETTLDGYKEARVLQTGSLAYEDEVTYNLRMWMDESVTADDIEAMNKTLQSKIVVTASISNYNPVDQGFTTLADAMLVNEYQTTSVEDAKARIESKQEPDFTKTAPIIDWQENHGQTTTSTSATMPHPDLVGQGGIYSKLTSSNVLPRIGTGYTFNSETGKYNITNYNYVDPTTLDYGSQDYYFCSSGLNTDSNDNVTTYHNVSNCTTIYKIVSATKSESTTTGSGGTKIKTQIYKITSYAYNQTELESDKSDKGLYTMSDEGGTSYYYRGSVNNNYVLFGGYYWRIIRQNGDGSIRMLYAGKTADATGGSLNMTLTDSSLGYNNKSTIQFNKTRTNPGYVGYMYGNTFNSSYEETNANENDSEIKKYLDSWYKQNILDTGLSEYIADSGFCNDRSLSTVGNNGDGVQTTNKHTYYAGHQRYYQTKEPTLTCPNASNDLFTLSGNSKGNEALTYPIGLITVDELMLSGLADGYLNKSAYTYSSSTYWGMSPSAFNVSTTAAYEFYGNYAGYAGLYYVTGTNGVRAVLNLKSDTRISGGIGTANDPYIVETN